ncbi:hypothetical protein TRVA0_033S00606 [Trichomonascus vanleenenianus]|uniref:uncharacterized protein n=1 Tax=Trichomonascus vanleenenianus TaxID=2268995 RepID=UPI003ECB68E5
MPPIKSRQDPEGTFLLSKCNWSRFGAAHLSFDQRDSTGCSRCILPICTHFRGLHGRLSIQPFKKKNAKAYVLYRKFLEVVSAHSGSSAACNVTLIITVPYILFMRWDIHYPSSGVLRLRRMSNCLYSGRYPSPNFPFAGCEVISSATSSCHSSASRRDFG